MVPSLVAAMAFLAGLAIVGWVGAEALTRHWEGGADSTFTVEVPKAGEPDVLGQGTRLQAVQTLLMAEHHIESMRVLSDQEMNSLLRPWLGVDARDFAVPLPAVISVHMAGKTANMAALASQLAQRVPGSVLENHGTWVVQMRALSGSLQLCAGVVLLVVTMVTAMVIVVATRASLVTRREAILVVSQLGATDDYIAGRFASRSAAFSFIGGTIGGTLVLVVILALAVVLTPLAGDSFTPTTADVLFFLPMPLWLLPLILPVAAALIGYITSRITVRRWLRHFP
jgi:cell division transport system permease protein